MTDWSNQNNDYEIIQHSGFDSESLNESTVNSNLIDGKSVQEFFDSFLRPQYTPPPIPEKKATLQPVLEKERFASLDVIRGMAIFGILVVNIQDFALVTGARYGYWISGGVDEVNKLIWTLTFVLFDTKFIAIFTMLFGASIALYSDKRKSTGKPIWSTYYSRMFALVLIGSLHTVFLWDGDILYDYAVFGLILYLAPRFPVVVLAIISGMCIWLNGVDTAMTFPDFHPIYEHYLLDIYHGTWNEQLHWRLRKLDWELLSVPMFFLFQAVGHMTLGMVLLRIKFLTGKWPSFIYWIIGLVGMSIGLFLIHRGTAFRFEFHTPEQGFDFYWGSLIMSFGWMGLAIGASKTLWILWPVRAFASAGRMALSNYIMQTLICTTIFYGYGFGMYERMDRTGMLMVIVGIVIFEMVASWLWLKKFRFGPMEWVWRTLTYRKFQPMLYKPKPAIPNFSRFDAELDRVGPIDDLTTGEEPEAHTREDNDDVE